MPSLNTGKIKIVSHDSAFKNNDNASQSQMDHLGFHRRSVRRTGHSKHRSNHYSIPGMEDGGSTHGRDFRRRFGRFSGWHTYRPSPPAESIQGASTVSPVHLFGNDERNVIPPNKKGAYPATGKQSTALPRNRLTNSNAKKTNQIHFR